MVTDMVPSRVRHFVAKSSHFRHSQLQSRCITALWRSAGSLGDVPWRRPARRHQRAWRTVRDETGGWSVDQEPRYDRHVHATFSHLQIWLLRMKRAAAAAASADGNDAWLHLSISKAVITTTIRLQFDRAIRPFDG